MAGIYIHIPFCKTRCIYCGFFSTTSLGKRTAYVDKLCSELSERRSYLPSGQIDTVYFGGGTPSQLPVEDVDKILQCIYNIYNVREEAEITLEGNPDDLSKECLTDLRRIGVNRLSMGVQTFDNRRLSFLRRRHSAEQAEQAVKMAQEAGFSNISIDLMFGFPSQSIEEWEQDLQKTVSLGVQHISAYSLMYEEGTQLTKMLEKGEVEEISDDLSLKMYEVLMTTLADNGYEHYEISNFAKPGFRSRHNSSYWQGIPYLGVGAGAHSYDGKRRHFNPDSLTGYLSGAALDEEVLTSDMLYDEFVFTALRTSEGINLDELSARFGEQRKAFCMANADKHLKAGLLVCENGVLRLTRKGLFVSNDVMSDLMFVD